MCFGKVRGHKDRELVNAVCTCTEDTLGSSPKFYQSSVEPGCPITLVMAHLGFMTKGISSVVNELLDDGA